MRFINKILYPRPFPAIFASKRPPDIDFGEKELLETVAKFAHAAGL
jgi:hypothetical protein